MNQLPIIKIEIETMRQAIAHSFADQLLSLDEQFQNALAKATAPEAIQQVLDHKVRRELHTRIEDEIESFFRRGPGAEIVRKEVVRRLAEELKTQLPE